MIAIQKTFKQQLIAGFALFTLAVASFVSTAPAQAADLLDKACAGNADSAVCKSKDEGKTKEEAGAQVRNVINTILMILGIIAVIMIIIGGFRYVLSSGDPNGIKQGKDTIIYACVGLVVAIMSYSIVNFFIFRFAGQ